MMQVNFITFPVSNNSGQHYGVNKVSNTILKTIGLLIDV